MTQNYTAMATIQSITVKETTIRTITQNGIDYICLTDIARQKNPIEPKDVVKNWMRSKNTIEYLGMWELLNNPLFKGVEFDPLLQEAGSNAFTMSPSRWIELTNAVGILIKNGSRGGTYAQRDIAFKFASWVSVEFELYLIKEFQRLKAAEQQAIGWSAKRELAKINYHIHTDAIKGNLIPKEIDDFHRSMIYAEEADVLNVALFGMTAKEWRVANPDLKGNMRDYATINQLICLSNIENQCRIHQRRHYTIRPLAQTQPNRHPTDDRFREYRKQKDTNSKFIILNSYLAIRLERLFLISHSLERLFVSEFSKLLLWDYLIFCLALMRAVLMRKITAV